MIVVKYLLPSLSKEALAVLGGDKFDNHCNRSCEQKVDHHLHQGEEAIVMTHSQHVC